MYKGQFILNEKTAAEVAVGICKSLQKYRLIVFTIASLALCAINLFRMSSMNLPTAIVSWAIALLGIIILLVLFTFEKKNSVKKAARTLMEQLDTSYHSEELIKYLTFEDEKVLVDNGDTVKDFWYMSITKIIETEKQILFRMKGNLYLWVEKSTIEGGSLEEFKSFINSKMGK
ncbi:MAG: YcxB family protein [Lachnospiraceae bacterium]|nr:YcxB family protein [Lachnospiraceae bacterium]